MESFINHNGHDTTKILGWLDELEIIGEEDEQEVKDQSQPRTPQRRIILEDEEISPTNTSFSNTTIFDPPYLARREECSDDDTFSLPSTSPSATPPSESPLEKPKATHKPKYTPRPNLAKPLSTLLTIEPYPALTRTSPNTHVSLQPCLCCALSSLPCCLTLPICSRCKRGKKTCMFMRKRTSQDPGAASHEMCNQPVFVRQLDSDEEWEGKLEMVREVIGKEEEREGRKNWVLPMPVERER